MAVTVLPGFQTLTEFGAYHGDCGECAALGVLHSLNPARWPLALDTLNHLTADAISHGEADAALSGGMNVPNLSAMLDRLGIAHTTVGYADFTLDRLHNDLKANAGHAGVIVEWSVGGALPGDESAVRFHYSSCGGIDTGPAGDGVNGAYLWCDGDNRASGPTPGAPLRYSWSQVVAAQPIGYLIITQEAAAMAWHIQPDGSGVDDRGHTCGGGLMAAIGPNAANGLDGETAPGAFGFTVPGVAAWLPLEDDTLAIWTGSAAQVVPHGGELMHAFAGALAQAFTHAHDLEAQNTALQDEIQKLQSQPTAQPITLAQACAVIGAAFNGKVA